MLSPWCCTHPTPLHTVLQYCIHPTSLHTALSAADYPHCYTCPNCAAHAPHHCTGPHNVEYIPTVLHTAPQYLHIPPWYCTCPHITVHAFELPDTWASGTVPAAVNLSSRAKWLLLTGRLVEPCGVMPVPELAALSPQFSEGDTRP